MPSYTTYFSALLALSAGVNSAAISPARNHKGGHTNKHSINTTASANTAKALYFITNDANNSIVAIPIGANGTLSDGTLTPTGGAGGNEVNAAGAALAPDALSSQGAVRVAGNVSPDPYTPHNSKH